MSTSQTVHFRELRNQRRCRPAPLEPVPLNPAPLPLNPPPLNHQGQVIFTNCSFSENSGTNGGAVWVYRTCAPESDATCGNATFTNTNFTNNTAIGGGGGAFFTFAASHVSYTCNRTDNPQLDATSSATATLCGAAPPIGTATTVRAATQQGIQGPDPAFASLDIYAHAY